MPIWRYKDYKKCVKLTSTIYGSLGNLGADVATNVGAESQRITSTGTYTVFDQTFDYSMWYFFASISISFTNTSTMSATTIKVYIYLDDTVVSSYSATVPQYDGTYHRKHIRANYVSEPLTGSHRIRLVASASGGSGDGYIYWGVKVFHP